MLDYFKVRLARAYTDLKASVIADLAGSFIGAAGAAIVLPGIGMFAGAAPQQELRLLIAYSVLGPVALIPIMYVVFYLRAGPKIYAEQRSNSRGRSSQRDGGHSQRPRQERHRWRSCGLSDDQRLGAGF